MNALPEDSAPNPPRTYTPGRVNAKRTMLLACLGLLVFGLTQLWTPARLLFTGERARAEAVRVVKERPGAEPVVLANDAALAAQLEPRDRRYVFWNEFRFRARDGSVREFRAGVGSQLRPLFRLTDDDGLPTTVRIWYDPAEPSAVILPSVISTWVAPLMLTFLGLLGAVIAAVLLYWARRPIELPAVRAGGVAPRGPGDG